MIKFENPVNGRFYYIKTTIDLLGHAVLTIIRGGKYSNAIIIKHFGYNSTELIAEKIKEISKVRERRGYFEI